MKKILAIALALLMMATTVSLAACGKDDPTPKDPDDDEFEYNYSSDTDADTKDPSDSEDEDKQDNESPTGEWIDKNDKIVVAMDRVVLLEGPGRDYDTVATLSWDTILDRKGTNGSWHKVSYDGQECYINADYTTREINDFKFVDYPEAEQVALHVKGDFKINLRTTPFYPEYDPEDNLIFSGFRATETDAAGESLKLIAKSESGNWYKVSFTGTWGSKTYENKICYLAASNAQYVDGLSTSTGSSNGESVRG